MENFGSGGAGILACFVTPVIMQPSDLIKVTARLSMVNSPHLLENRIWLGNFMKLTNSKLIDDANPDFKDEIR